MGDKFTQRKTRGVGLENFLKASLRVAADHLVQKGHKEATLWLRQFMNSDRHVSIGYAIERSIMPRLREAERQKPDKDRAPESALVYDARMRVIRDFEELLIVALRRDEPGFFEDVLEVIQQIAVLGCTEFRRREMYFLPRNPIAYLRAIVEAYRTGKTINSILGWAPDQPRNAHQAAEARRFLKALTMLVAPDDPGYAKIGGLRMSEEANGGSAAAPTITPVPVAEMPTQEIEIKSVQLVFQGKGELELAGVFEEAAKKHGGWEQFILLLAASLAKQKDKK